MIDQIPDALGHVINRGWLNRLRVIVDSHPECLSKPLEIGAMSLGGRRLSDIACVELVVDRGMEVSARLPGLDSCFKYCPSVAQFLMERGLEPN